MNREDIFNKIKEVFDEHFDNEVCIDMDTSAEKLEEWDSVEHIQLIFEIEEAFDIQFDAEEIPEMNTIAKLISVIERKK